MDFKPLFKKRNLTYNQFQSLLLLDDAGSIKETAPQRKITESSVARHLDALETFFGFKIRDSSKKNAELTPKGKRLAALIRRQLIEVQDFCDKSSKSVSISAGDSLLHLVVLPKLQGIQGKFKDKVISVQDSNSAELKQNLQNFVVDFGLLRKESVDRTLSHSVLGQYKYGIFASRELVRSRSGKSIFELPFALIRNHWGKDFKGMFQENGQELPNVQVLCENFTHVLRLVRLGGYAGILPIFAKDILPDTDYVNDTPAFLNKSDATIVLAWNPKLLTVRPAIAPFISFLGQELKLVM